MNAEIISKFSEIAESISLQWEKESVENLHLFVEQYPFHQPLSQLVEGIKEWANEHDPSPNFDLSLPVSLEGKINEWAKAAIIITDNWQEEWNEKYPFDKNFEDIVWIMHNWGLEKETV